MSWVSSRITGPQATRRPSELNRSLSDPVELVHDVPGCGADLVMPEPEALPRRIAEPNSARRLGTVS